MILSNPFYTGRYEFPLKSGKWHKGKHDAIISQELFDRVQENLTLIPKGVHGSKEFSFIQLFFCGACGAGITVEEKIKKLRDGTIKRYVYYHCTRQLDKDYRETFLREEALIAQLTQLVDKLNIDELRMTEMVKAEYERVQG